MDSRLLSGIPDLTGTKTTASMEFGVYGFTPEDIDVKNIIRDDRPYSILVYLSTSRNYWDAGRDDGWTTSLTVGAPGLDVFEAGQNAIHKVVGSDRAEGWKHQVQMAASLRCATLQPITTIWHPAVQTGRSRRLTSA